MSITTFSSYKDKLRSAVMHRRYKNVQIGSAVGPWISTWRASADQPSTPTTAVSNLDASSAGSLVPLIGASGTPRLAQVECQMSTRGMLFFADRLAHIGGLSGTVATAQTVAIGPNSRITDYTLVQAGIEIYTQIGATATTATVSYTNDQGVSGRTSPAFVIGGTGSREQNRMLMVPLQEGDRGVKSVESITLAATTGTAGNFGVTLFRPLCMMAGLQNGVTFLWDAVFGGSCCMPDVTNTCLMLMDYINNAQGGDCFMDLRFVDA